ncbi:MAG: hypothetical protein LBJ20_01725 [Candidatus Methanoplasma sp.]|jgi:Arc/MetJ-type ribon-helix-helix transcriptional regulator|nr:hypothetical protein [Candidatus Methanoplasma sp.]
MVALSIKITDKDLEAIRIEVQKGNAMNTSDFVRRAVFEKILKSEASA